MKTIGFMHPDKTMYLDMPDEIYEVINHAIKFNVIKSRFVDTPNGMRGNNAQIFIMDELTEKETKNE